MQDAKDTANTFLWGPPCLQYGPDSQQPDLLIAHSAAVRVHSWLLY